MAWNLTEEPRGESNDRVHISFDVDGPARFELMVDEDGNTVLFGYAGQAVDLEQEPSLAFDTDGSFWLDPEVQA